MLLIRFAQDICKVRLKHFFNSSLTLEKLGKLTDIFFDRGLMVKSKRKMYRKILVNNKKRYMKNQKAIAIFLQFSKSYLCELGFSSILATINPKKCKSSKN